MAALEALYDSFILAPALDAECDTVYSEDMQDGQEIGEVTIRNPFVPRTSRGVMRCNASILSNCSDMGVGSDMRRWHSAASNIEGTLIFQEEGFQQIKSDLIWKVKDNGQIVFRPVRPK